MSHGLVEDGADHSAVGSTRRTFERRAEGRDGHRGVASADHVDADAHGVGASGDDGVAEQVDVLAVFDDRPGSAERGGGTRAGQHLRGTVSWLAASNGCGVLACGLGELGCRGDVGVVADRAWPSSSNDRSYSWY